MVVVDGTGNTRTQTLGPIYVDAPQTPGLVADLDYHAWANDVCTLVGVDRRLAQALLVKVVADRQRFPAPGSVQALAGTCPVTEQTGKRKTVKFRKTYDEAYPLRQCAKRRKPRNYGGVCFVAGIPRNDLSVTTC